MPSEQLLLPCPFDGREAQISEFHIDGDPALWYVAECLVCPVKTYDQSTRAEAVKIWNQRAAPAVAMGEQVCPRCGYDPSKWVTVGTIKVDIETETETFERAPSLPALDSVIENDSALKEAFDIQRPKSYTQTKEATSGAGGDEARLWGELRLDSNGDAHFICHTQDDDFAATKIAFKKFIALLQGQIRNEQECPFYGNGLADLLEIQNRFNPPLESLGIPSSAPAPRPDRHNPTCMLEGTCDCAPQPVVGKCGVCGHGNVGDDGQCKEVIGMRREVGGYTYPEPMPVYCGCHCDFSVPAAAEGEPTINVAAEWVVRRHDKTIDHACVECLEGYDKSTVIEGFQCYYHQALAALAAARAGGEVGAGDHYHDPTKPCSVCGDGG